MHLFVGYRLLGGSRIAASLGLTHLRAGPGFAVSASLVLFLQRVQVLVLNVILVEVLLQVQATLRQELLSLCVPRLLPTLLFLLRLLLRLASLSCQLLGLIQSADAVELIGISVHVLLRQAGFGAGCFSLRVQLGDKLRRGKLLVPLKPGLPLLHACMGVMILRALVGAGRL